LNNGAWPVHVSYLWKLFFDDQGGFVFLNIPVLNFCKKQLNYKLMFTLSIVLLINYAPFLHDRQYVSLSLIAALFYRLKTLKYMHYQPESRRRCLSDKIVCRFCSDF